jgi:hypothetical protein
MLQPRFRATVVLLGMLALAAVLAAARADDRGYYRSEPQIRLGIDLIWGGYAYAPPRPPVAWYPVRPYYEPHRSDYRAGWRGDGHGRQRGHRKHHHRQHHDERRRHHYDD